MRSLRSLERRTCDLTYLALSNHRQVAGQVICQTISKLRQAEPTTSLKAETLGDCLGYSVERNQERRKSIVNRVLCGRRWEVFQAPLHRRSRRSRCAKIFQQMSSFTCFTCFSSQEIVKERHFHPPITAGSDVGDSCLLGNWCCHKQKHQMLYSSLDRIQVPHLKTPQNCSAQGCTC